MPRVIFRKNGKTISIPWWYCSINGKIKGLYEKGNSDNGLIVFNPEITEVVFDGCKIGSNISFCLLEYQKLVLVDCEFDSNGYYRKLHLYGGSLDIYNSVFKNYYLDINGCNSVSLRFNGDVLNDITIRSSNISMEGNFNVNRIIDVVADNTIVENVNLSTECVGLCSRNLTLKNSSFEFSRQCFMGYNKLFMDDVTFFSDYGNLYFKDIVAKKQYDSIYSDIATYNAPIALSDDDILSEKQKTIYSLLSVLKGYSQNVNRINLRDIERNSSKINDQYNLRLEEILKKQEILEQQRQKLIEQYKVEVELANKDLSNRKVKSLTYPKK